MLLPRRLNLTSIHLLLLALSIGGLESVRAQSTVLILRNGDRLTGTVLREDTNQVSFKTTWWNVVVVPVAEIKSRETVPPGAGPAGVLPAPGGPPTPAPPVLAIPAVALKPKTPKVWTGEAQLGADLLFNEHNRELFSGRFKTTYFQAPFRATLDYQAAYGKTDGVITDNRMFGSIKTDWDFSRRLYAYNLAGAGYDLARKTDLRYEVGPGLGWHIFKYSNFVFNAESGANYQAQFYTDRTKIESFYLRFAEDSAWKINSRLSMDEKFEFFPRVDNWEQYRFRAESNLRYALWHNLSLIFTMLDQYDTQPARGVPQNSLQLTSSLGFKF